jgi:acyl-CoA dehydrogenase
MEVLHMFGNEEQKEQWLKPLLNGDIRSAFAMTEPDVASSDATNIQTSIVREGDEYVINGRKWFITNAHHPNCRIFIVMGKTDFEADTYRQQSMVLVPMDTPGVELVRNITTINHHSPEGHSEVLFKDVRVPASNLIANEGDGFMIAQARLGPGRIHHCMRAIGMSEVCLELMVARSQERKTFGKYLYKHGSISEWIARSRIEIEQARLLVLKAASMIDQVGAKGARKEISMIKVVAPTLLTTIAYCATRMAPTRCICRPSPGWRCGISRTRWSTRRIIWRSPSVRRCDLGLMVRGAHPTFDRTPIRCRVRNAHHQPRNVFSLSRRLRLRVMRRFAW